MAWRTAVAASSKYVADTRRGTREMKLSSRDAVTVGSRKAGERGRVQVERTGWRLLRTRRVWTGREPPLDAEAMAAPVLLLGVGAGARRRQLLQASPRLLERA